MIRPSTAFLTIALFSLSSGCSRPPPDEVKTIKTPQADVHLTYEYWNLGPLVSDSARLVAHLVKDGIEDRQIVIDGDYIDIRKISWPRPDRMVVCVTYLDQVSEWNKSVMLKAGNLSKTIHVELRAAAQRDNNRKNFDPPPPNNCPIVASST